MSLPIAKSPCLTGSEREPRRRAASIAALVLVALVPAGLAAQGASDTPTPLGRQGALWDADMQIEKEQMAKFVAGLEALSQDEWKEQSVAWAELHMRVAERRIDLPRAFHVLDVDAGKRAEVEVDPLDEAWYVAFGKKAPKEIDLILTDSRSTRVNCPLSDVPDDAQGHLGIFVLETRVLCFFREMEEEPPA
jgi:hypothetical protein